MGQNPLDPLEAIGPRPPIAAADLANDVEGARRADAVSGVMAGALERLGQSPGANDPATDLRDQLTGHAGPVVEAHTDILSDVARPGANPSTPNAEGSEDISQKIRSLYIDLTNYQVAWRIAQRTQQDIGQLLRGT